MRSAWSLRYDWKQEENFQFLVRYLHKGAPTYTHIDNKANVNNKLQIIITLICKLWDLWWN